MIKVENKIYYYLTNLNNKKSNQKFKKKRDSSIFQSILNEEMLKTEKPKNLSLKRGIIVNDARKIN